MRTAIEAAAHARHALMIGVGGINGLMSEILKPIVESKDLAAMPKDESRDIIHRANTASDCLKRLAGPLMGEDAHDEALGCDSWIGDVQDAIAYNVGFLAPCKAFKVAMEPLTGTTTSKGVAEPFSEERWGYCVGMNADAAMIYVNRNQGDLFCLHTGDALGWAAQFSFHLSDKAIKEIRAAYGKAFWAELSTEREHSPTTSRDSLSAIGEAEQTGGKG